MKLHLVFLCFAPVVWTQSNTPAFEVTSVRPLGPAEVSRGMTMDGGRLRIHGFSLQSVILAAYQIRETQLVGPAWLANERFVIEATLPPNAREDQLPTMLQGLLAERFMLRARHVGREQTVYAIVPDPKGLKIRQKTSLGPTPPTEPAAFRVFSGSAFMTGPGDFKFVLAGGDLQITPGPNGVHLKASRISSLVELFSLCADKPVVDRTNLKDSYEIELDVTDEQIDDRVSAIMAPPGANAAEPEPIDAGSLRQMLRGLGLNVENRTESVDTLIIDSIEKTPTPN